MWLILRMFYAFKNRLFIIFFLLTFINLQAQNLRLGEWKSHLNYSRAKKCEEVNDKIYCISDNGFFYVNTTDLSMVPLSKTDGFYDNIVQTMEYDITHDLLMIVYTNTYINLVKGNTISSLTDIFRKNFAGKKTINHVSFYKGKAYISSSFGIIVYDIQKNEISESYQEIGNNGSIVEVFSTAFINDSIFAATGSGILAAAVSNPNLLDYRAWTLLAPGSCTKIIEFQNYLFTDLNGKISTYNNGKWQIFIDSLQNDCQNIEVSHQKMTLCFSKYIYSFSSDFSFTKIDLSGAKSAIYDKNGKLWIAHPLYGMLKYDNGNYSFFSPNGPYSGNCWDIATDPQTTYVAPGGLTFTGSASYNLDGFFYYQNGEWHNKNFTNDNKLVNIFDFIKVAVNPVSKEVYWGSFGDGLFLWKNNQIAERYTDNNSTLQKSIENPDKINIRGLCFDNKQQLWVSNYGAPQPLSVKKTDNTWVSYYLGGGKNRNIGDLIVDQAGRKWILLPMDGGIIVFDETRQQNDQYRVLTKDENNGNLPSERIYAIALDKKGRIWIGSEDGVAVFYNPSGVFSSSGSNASKIWVNSGNTSGYLLASEIVTAIAVDGANKKWLGTKNGVWYVSEDGSEIIYHFNKKNSPLPSDNIRDIAVNPVTGEVFFGTDAGIVSFRNKAIEGNLVHEEVYAYPNPVRPDYSGPVAIRGLVSNANVKITDVAGNLVNDITAEGGQAVWNMTDIRGNPVSSGVYFVFSSNEDGSETFITKILIIR